ncbi:unnamed protein product [Danaus chrysippus]|uniref:(African queen) hypothetical protein n=1 Tax=Danaus chrysippus TaxID=151541 RepID=A0A8J2QNU6_9NEOP|nr:unnamed protein product [Danaus chrysippus]
MMRAGRGSGALSSPRDTKRGRFLITSDVTDIFLSVSQRARVRRTLCRAILNLVLVNRSVGVNRFMRGDVRYENVMM